MERICADATVDPLGQNQFEVCVTGRSPYDHRRVYTIGAHSDNAAAFKGLAQFQEEMEALHSED